jgi:peptidoglycan/LPS O-acetylase OafA/YrhL
LPPILTRDQRGRNSDVQSLGSKATRLAAGRVPGLDGIRGSAIAMVFALHLSPGRFSGGFVGLEIFFVLSGFLITGVLLDEWAVNHTISLRGFYLRRAARLLPALLITIVGVHLLYLADGSLVTPSEALVALAKVVFYVGNWFEAARPGSLYYLSDTWSLSIEEQFYLTWPVLLLLMLRAGRSMRFVAGLTLGLAVASMGERLAIATSDPYAAYFRSDTRACGLLLGVALGCAMAVPRWRARFTLLADTPLTVAAIVVLTVEVFVLHVTAPGTYAVGLPAAAGAAAVLITHCVTRQSVATAVLGSRLPVWLGQRSYGIYLYHIPIVRYLTPPRLHGNVLLAEALRVGLALGMAEISYRLVEAPILGRFGRGGPGFAGRAAESQPRDGAPGAAQTASAGEPGDGAAVERARATRRRPR